MQKALVSELCVVQRSENTLHYVPENSLCAKGFSITCNPIELRDPRKQNIFLLLSVCCTVLTSASIPQLLGAEGSHPCLYIL